MNHLRRYLCVPAVALVLVLGSSCSSSPPTRYFLLGSEVPGHQTAPASGLSVGVGPVKVPERLDQPYIMTVVRDHEVRLAESCEWVEPLDKRITEVVGENLARLLMTDRVYQHPWRTDEQVDYSVALTVLRLDGSLGASAFLEVRWSLLDRNGKELLRKKSSFSRPLAGRSFDSFAATISALLADLSREMAVVISAGGLASSSGHLSDTLMPLMPLMPVDGEAVGEVVGEARH